MGKSWFVVFTVAICSSASAGVILNVPGEIVPPPVSPYNFSLDLGFLLTAPTVSQPLAAYDLTLQVSGGSGLSITGVGTGSDLPANAVFGSDPAYSSVVDPIAGTLYCFGDYLDSGTATITNGSALLRVKARLQPGATGTYDINVFVDASSGWTTQFYSGYNGGNPTPITGMTFQGGTISVALPGDANLDGKVDINDLTKVLTNYNLSTGMAWGDGDFNGDGKVDINDLTIVLTSYGQSLGSSAGRSGLAAVPEPSGAGLARHRRDRPAGLCLATAGTRKRPVSPDYSRRNRNPKRKRGRHSGLASLTLRVTIAHSASPIPAA